MKFLIVATLTLMAPVASWAASANLAVKVTTTVNATNFCAANGGGNGSAGNPWQAACIQAAVNAASDGDTVFLAAGNWALNTSHAAVVVTKPLNLVGAGSGNTFDEFGHPNNANGNPASSFSGITRVFTTGPFTGCNGAPSTGCTSSTPGPGGSIQFGIFPQTTNCTNISVQHLFVDGSVGYAGGDRFATLSFIDCQGPILVNDIRTLSWGKDGTVIGGGETQFNMSDVVRNATIQSSVIADPALIVNGDYPGTQGLQITYASNILLDNDYFYQILFNPIYIDSLVHTRTQTFYGIDSVGAAPQIPAMGMSGCQIGPGVSSSPQGCTVTPSATNGNVHYTVSNSYFNSNSIQASEDFSVGIHVNDPSTSGGVQDVNFVGNWVVAHNSSIASCDWHFWDPVSQTYGVDCAPGTTDSPGMQINGTVNSDCTESDTTANNYGFNVNNNSIIGTYAAVLDAAGTGILNNCWIDGTTQTTHTNTVVNFRASKNYVSSPKNDYHSSVETHNPTVTSNFCAGGGGTFTQTDSTQCATTGFTSAPTAAFTLGTLSNGVVPFATTSFTAQYGAVQWLASTSSTTPTSGDARWRYIPPFSLAATHGNTVYLWTMDSANHISAAASAVVP